MITIPNTQKPDFTAEEVRAIAEKFHTGKIIVGEKIIDFSDYAPLAHANLSGLQGEKFNFKDMNFRNASFRKSFIDWSHFPFCQLHFCDFYMSSLFGLYMYRASIHKSNFRWANMEHSNMEEIYDFGSDYTRADLYFAQLKRARMVNVNFSYTDLRCVNFSCASLYGVDFRGAALDGSTFANAIIKDCIFDDDQKEFLKNAVIK